MFSNFLEHAGITVYFDPLEDIAETVVVLMLMFFINNWRKNRSEARFRELFTMAPMALAEVDRDGRITKVNEFLSKKIYQFYGIATDELSSRHKWWELIFPDPAHRESVLSKWQKAAKETHGTAAAINSEEREITCQDGTKRTIIVGANIIGEKILFSMIDITDRKRAEQDREKLQKQLFQSQKLEAIGILAGGVAHDFNNILGAIMGYAELTLEEMGASDPFREHIEKILDATQRSIDLARQLLIFARKQRVAPKPIDLNAKVGDMLNMLRRLIGENIELEWLPSENDCTVEMDPSQLDQIMVNLCVNARDAIADVGRIVIETHTAFFDDLMCKTTHVDCLPGTYARLSVVDNGSGMDKDTALHVFDPFFTTKEVGEGTGLGLATVYGIVKQSNGFINLYSEPGIGTTFNIYIPQHEKEGPQKQTRPGETIPQGHGETILLVEDDTMLVELSQAMLERLGYDVLTATTPGGAIQMARDNSHEIDLFLTDVVMPEMNGRELIERLLSIRPTAKHLFMSGYTVDVIFHRGISKTERHFIQKPFSLKDIAVKVREVLDEDGQ
ncbi:MAG: response regulator [Deltaproteobacteria bacterium]|nr:response regulator [Deltaproteobacteria bacterium]